MGRVHKYLEAWNDHLWEMKNAHLLTVYDAGFIDLDKQYLTIGFNGFIEGAEFLKTVDEYIPEQYRKLEILPNNAAYKQYAKDILHTIKDLNTKAEQTIFDIIRKWFQLKMRVQSFMHGINMMGML